VDLSIANKDELTPLDLSWVKIPQGLHYQSVSLFLILVLFLILSLLAMYCRV
jgi:hypothetical protein